MTLIATTMIGMLLAFAITLRLAAPKPRPVDAAATSRPVGRR